MRPSRNGPSGSVPDPRIVSDAPRIGRTPSCSHASTNLATPYRPSRSVSATAGMPRSPARRASASGENAPSLMEKYERTSRWTNVSTAQTETTTRRISVPQPLDVPPVAEMVVIQVPHCAATRLDAPVLAVASVSPPAPFDPPSPDHVGDLVPAPPPDERRGHAGIALDPNIDLLVVALGHAAPTPVTSGLDESNVCSSPEKRPYTGAPTAVNSDI